MFDSYIENLIAIREGITCAGDDFICKKHLFRGQSGDHSLIPSIGRNSTVRDKIESQYAESEGFISFDDIKLKGIYNSLNYTIRVQALQSLFNDGITDYLVSVLESKLNCDEKIEIEYKYSDLVDDLQLDTTVVSLSSFMNLQYLDYMQDTEELIFNEFLSRTRNNFSKSYTLWELLALAQHHGCPTRLLDWTSSIDVALFFATEGVESASNADCSYIPTEPHFYTYHACEQVNIAGHPFERIHPLRLHKTLTNDFFQFIAEDTKSCGSHDLTVEEICTFFHENIVYQIFKGHGQKDSHIIIMLSDKPDDNNTSVESRFSNYMYEKYQYEFYIPYLFQIILGMPFLIRVPAVTERMNSQYGLFTYHSLFSQNGFKTYGKNNDIMHGFGRILTANRIIKPEKLRQDLYWLGTRGENIYGDPGNIAKQLNHESSDISHFLPI